MAMDEHRQLMNNNYDKLSTKSFEQNLHNTTANSSCVSAVVVASDGGVAETAAATAPINAGLLSGPASPTPSASDDLATTTLSATTHHTHHTSSTYSPYTHHHLHQHHHKTASNSPSTTAIQLMQLQSPTATPTTMLTPITTQQFQTTALDINVAGVSGAPTVDATNVAVAVAAATTATAIATTANASTTATVTTATTSNATIILGEQQRQRELEGIFI